MVSIINILEYDKVRKPTTIQFSTTRNNVRKVYVLDWGKNPEDKLLFAHDNNQKGEILAQGPDKVEQAITELLSDLPDTLTEPKNLKELFVAARFWSWDEFMFC